MGTVIRGACVLTPEGLREDWGLRVDAGRISSVGPNASLAVQEDDEVVELPGRLLAPGFVNGHNHMYGFLSHGITAEALVTEFSSFLEDYWWPCVEDRLDHDLVAATTAWACVEMIDSGVTSFADILEGPHAIPGALEVEREIVEKAGLRGLLSFEACQRAGEDIGKLGLAENANFIRSAREKEGLTEGFLSIHTLFTCDEGYVKRAKALADESRAPMHMHLCESVYEPDWCMERYGRRPVQIYDEWGCLDGNVLASQVVQVPEEDLDILARRGVRVVTMPLSNCEVGGGVAPVTEMLERGMTVGLGTDGYVNNFFEVMRGAFLIHKAHRQDPQAMPAGTVYRMATELGAKALGLEDVGVLEPGKAADVIAIALDTPTPINASNVYDQLVLFRNPADVTDVMAAGRWLKRRGRILTLDPVQIKARLRKAAEAFWNPKR